MEKKQNKKAASTASTVNNEINLSAMFGLVFLSTYQEFTLVQSLVKYDFIQISELIENMRQKTQTKIDTMRKLINDSGLTVTSLKVKQNKIDLEKKIDLFIMNSLAMGMNPTREQAKQALSIIQGNGSVNLDNRKTKSRTKINHELTELESLFLDLYKDHGRQTSGEIEKLTDGLTNHQISRYGTISGYIASLLGDSVSNSFIDQLIIDKGIGNITEQDIRDNAPRSLISLGVNAFHIASELKK